MTFGNSLKPDSLILLRPQLYLSGTTLGCFLLKRIALGYFLLKVKRNGSGHKSFLISCAEALPRAPHMHGLSGVALWVQSSCGVCRVRGSWIKPHREWEALSQEDEQVGKGQQACCPRVVLSPFGYFQFPLRTPKATSSKDTCQVDPRRDPPNRPFSSPGSLVTFVLTY